MFNHFGSTLLSLLLVVSPLVLAQSLPGSSLPTTQPSGSSGSGEGDLEELYDKDEVKQPAPHATPSPERKAETRKIPAAQNLSDLAKLSPFSDIAVIERRFLPKTGRFEASVSAFTNLNNPFFSAYGGGVNLAYYLRERWAVEGIADFASTSARQVTNDLASRENITTSNLVTSNGFYGGALKWNPIYGKITWLNQSIVPFDFNFSGGFGLTHTTDGQSLPTLHFGTSQVFAYNKSLAFRWEVTWNYYQASTTNDSGQPTKLSQSDLYLGFGVSFYFPEASYR